MEQENGKQNLKEVWKFYVLALGGLGLVWLAQKVSAPLSTVFNVAGAIAFLVGVYLTLYWDRKRKQREEKENKK